MRLLGKVNGSVLWLYKSNSSAEINLKNEAKKKGIDPQRLIFANHMKTNKHLARIAYGDLALDTFPYTGVTTSFQSYLMGVPVLTLKGFNMNSRCGESINKNLGLK